MTLYTYILLGATVATSTFAETLSHSTSTEMVDGDLNFINEIHTDSDFFEMIGMALWAAVHGQDLHAVEQLLKSGANPNIILDHGTPPLPMPALHVAAMHGNLEITKVLVESGAKIDITMPAPSMEGGYVTPLGIARMMQAKDVYFYLLEKYIEAKIHHTQWLYRSESNTSQ